MSDLTVSVVICAYADERFDALREAVASALNQTHAAHEVIVVVDHNPGLLAAARAEFADASVIANPGVRGHSAAANAGAEAERGDIVAFLGDDAAADPEWLRWLVDGYETVDVLGVGGFLVPRWLGSRPEWMPEEFLWIVGCSYRGLPEERATVRNLIGANMSMRRKVYLALGGFRSELSRVGSRPYAGHEPELCIRAVARFPSGRFLHEPRARVHHRVTVERTTLRYFLRHCFDEGVAKADLAAMLGSDAALAAERDHARRIVTSVAVGGLVDSLRCLSLRPLLQTCAGAAGLAFAGVGYVTARIRRHGLLPDPAPLQARSDGMATT